MSKTYMAGAVLGLIMILAAVHYSTTENEKAADLYYGSESGSIAERTENDPAPETLPPNPKNMQHTVTIETNMGTIAFVTYDGDAPKTVANFVGLAQKGFYDNLTFHRVVPGFVIQGGDPSGNGTGGPGYKFEDELDPNTESARAGYQKGVVAMANAGPNTNGSQFFIMLETVPLPHAYTIFGKVISGQDVVDKIGRVARGANDMPVEPVIMKKVTVQENP